MALLDKTTTNLLECIICHYYGVLCRQRMTSTSTALHILAVVYRTTAQRFCSNVMVVVAISRFSQHCILESFYCCVFV